MNIDRKDFLKGAALSAGSLAALSAFGCAPSASSGIAGSAAEPPEGFSLNDYEESSAELDLINTFSDEKTYDIVVVGAGTSGLPH